MINDQQKAILDVVNRIDADLSTDRQNLQELTIRMGKVELQLEELRKVVNNLPQRVQDKTAEAMQPVMDSADSLSEKIDKKRFKILREPFSLKKLFAFWKK